MTNVIIRTNHKIIELKREYENKKKGEIYQLRLSVLERLIKFKTNTLNRLASGKVITYRGLTESGKPFKITVPSDITIDEISELAILKFDIKVKIIFHDKSMDLELGKLIILE